MKLYCILFGFLLLSCVQEDKEPLVTSTVNCTVPPTEQEPDLTTQDSVIVTAIVQLR